MIVEKGSVLIGRRSRESFEGQKWCLPCGFVEYDEDFLTAACRETKEETGLMVRLKSIINVTGNFLTPALHSMVTVFLAERIAGTLTAGDDLDAVQWFSLKGPFPELAFEADAEIINRYAATRIKGLPIQSGFEFKG